MPYAPYLFIQSGKMSPNHEGETGKGNISGVEVVLDCLVYVGMSCEYGEVAEGVFGVAR